MKLIFVLSKHYINPQGLLKDAFHGIGDVVNGIAYCIEYCKYHNIEFKIAVQEGSNYQNLFNFRNLLYQSSFEIPFFIEDLRYLDLNNDFFIFTNGCPEFHFENCSTETKELIKEIFFPIREKPKSIFPNILHIRSGDHSFVDKSVLDKFYISDHSHPFSPYDLHLVLNSQARADCILDYLSLNGLEKKFDIIISDDSGLKRKISNATGLYSKDFEAIHFGVHESNEKSLRETLEEFQLIFYSKYILSIASFPYGVRKSNFVHIPACIGSVNAKYASLNIFEKKIIDI